MSDILAFLNLAAVIAVLVTLYPGFYPQPRPRQGELKGKGKGFTFSLMAITLNKSFHLYLNPLRNQKASLHIYLYLLRNLKASLHIYRTFKELLY